MRNTDYADELVLLANTPAEVEFLLHSLEQVAEGAISTLSDKPMKLVDSSHTSAAISHLLKTMSTYG